jgi:hypothetical protein
MSDDHPTILEQIDAVEWAEAHAQEWAEWLKYAQLQTTNIADLCRRLEAAAETLRTLEFGSEIAR